MPESIKSSWTMLTSLLVLVLVQCACATEYAHSTVTPGGGEMVPGLHADLPRNTRPPLVCFSQTINFHDFSKGLVAMKILEKGQCYVKASDETYEEIKDVVDCIKPGRW